MSDIIVFLAPLGCDYNISYTDIGPQTISRCETAVNEYFRLKERGYAVRILLAPGCRRDQRVPGNETMAAMMGRWFCDRNVHTDDLVVNHDDPLVWKTVGEVAWHLQQVRRITQATNTFANSRQINCMARARYRPVTNSRHQWRVRRSYWLETGQNLYTSIINIFELLSDQIAVDHPVIQPLISYEEPPTWRHELLGHSKIILLGIGRFLRRMWDNLCFQIALWRS